MYSSRYSLEVLAKTSIRSLGPTVHLRGLGSTGCARFVAAAHKVSGARTSPIVFKSETLEPEAHAPPDQGNTPRYRPRIKPASWGPPKDRGPPREVHISTKVRRLCRAGNFEEAVEVCENAPVALQGAPAWNIVIHYALSEGRYNYAYRSYQQMKKRQIVPTVITYTMFMTAYAQANPENLTSIHLERVHNLYKNWVNLVLSTKTKNAVASATSVHPAAAYISVLANAKLYQSIWDTFYELDLEGPLAPDQFVFTAMIAAFAKRTAIPNDTTTSSDATLGDTTSSEILDVTSTLSDVKVKNAQDTRLLWRMVLRSLEREPFPVDSYLVVAALRALKHGGQPELDLALTIIDRYLGLRAPDAPTPSESIEPLELNSRLLDSALTICNAAKRPELTRHFLDVLTAPGHPQRPIVSTGSMNYLLKAYASLGDIDQIIQTIDWMIREAALPGGLEVMPGGSSWCIALRACLAAQNWDATKNLTKRLASMTNIKRMIDPETIYLVLKITYALKPENERDYERRLRQALDAVHFVVSIWPKDPKGMHEYSGINLEKAERRFVFQNALGDLVKTIFDEFEGLRFTPGFDDLAYRLNRSRVDIPSKIVARYKAYL